MPTGIIDLEEYLSCEDNCDGEDSDGVPCQDIEDPPWMGDDDDN